ncbi:hypothetical protein GOBAR_AA00946 [Gossypium barbadense]|uniref:Uncharacterized protein n=1 Tax=Gossypium barbadense TaxID=3634 RepID=A0A2P5YVI9_GOSBA|nr:hypothetical protein GOBAR_AA00946 [Gossypium barbadense]
MLTKFISVSKTHFQNIKIAVKNQQASIQWLKTQIGQLAKLIYERPQGSLPSNTKSNPREQLNTITIQDKEGLVEPEPEPMQGIVLIEALLQMPNAVKFLKELLANKRKLDEASHETNLKSTHEPCSSNNKEPIYKEQRLQIEELDEWRTHKPRTHDKPKPHHDELNISPNQLKVRDKVLLDAVDPCIATPEPKEAIPLTVLSIFPYGIVELIHPKFGTFKVNSTRLKPYFDEIDSRNEECKLLAPSWPCKRESSKAHHHLGTRNSTGKCSPRLSCPARPPR